MSAPVRHYAGPPLEGPRMEVPCDSPLFPPALRNVRNPPGRLYVAGDPHALQEGLAVVGARKATPYGLACAERFSRMAAECGVAVISGGALGCDGRAHQAAIDAGGATVAFLGGGCDEPYPARHAGLFQRIVDAGGAVVSEHPWGFPPKPFTFRERNRLIAGLARATLIVEAGLPSGTFSTADEALAAGREVWVVPGAVTSASSRGANRLLCQGATPVVDDETFRDALLSVFGCLRQEVVSAEVSSTGEARAAPNAVCAALLAEPLDMEQLYSLARSKCRRDPLEWLSVQLAEGERDGLVVRYPDGRYGPTAKALERSAAG